MIPIGWSVEETEMISHVLSGIVASARADRAVEEVKIVLRSSEGLPLQDETPGGIFGVPIRHLMVSLGFDEHRPFRWRFEHKLVQALLLNYYAPGSIPVTRGLSRLFSHLD